MARGEQALLIAHIQGNGCFPGGKAAILVGFTFEHRGGRPSMAVAEPVWHVGVRWVVLLLPNGGLMAGDGVVLGQRADKSPLADRPPVSRPGLDRGLGLFDGTGRVQSLDSLVGRQCVSRRRGVLRWLGLHGWPRSDRDKRCLGCAIVGEDGPRHICAPDLPHRFIGRRQLDLDDFAVGKILDSFRAVDRLDEFRGRLGEGLMDLRCEPDLADRFDAAGARDRIVGKGPDRLDALFGELGQCDRQHGKRADDRGGLLARLVALGHRLVASGRWKLGLDLADRGRGLVDPDGRFRLLLHLLPLEWADGDPHAGPALDRLNRLGLKPPLGPGHPLPADGDLLLP